MPIPSSMFERFRSRFEIADGVGCSGEELLGMIDPLPDGLADLMIRWAGARVGGGLYRIHTPGEMSRMTRLADEVFPDLAGRALCFATDWLGREYAIDVGREAANGEPMLLLLDPWSTSFVEIDSVFVDFHDDDLVEYGDDILAVGLFVAWFDAGGSMPGAGKCAGYRVPPRAGGADHPDNLETVAVEAPWRAAALAGARALSEERRRPLAGPRAGPAAQRAAGGPAPLP